MISRELPILAEPKKPVTVRVAQSVGLRGMPVFAAPAQQKSLSAALRGLKSLGSEAVRGSIQSYSQF